MSEEYRDCDSKLSTVRKAARSSGSHPDRDDALAASPVESTVVLPGSLELRSARPVTSAPLAPPAAFAPPPVEPNLGSTGEGLAMSIPPPGAAIDTMRIPRGERPKRERVSFHVALTVAMLGVTIGLLSGRAMPSNVRAAAAPTTTAAATSAPATSATATGPRTVASDVTPLEGTVRGKAVRPAARTFNAPAVARRPADPGTPSASSTGPSAAEVNESLSALAEAQAARPF